MSKVAYLRKKLVEIKKVKTVLKKVEVKRLVGKVMLAVMLWQSVAQPALVLGNNANNETRKTEKDANATTPALQNPGDLVVVRHAPSINGSR
ncbi:MAG: hypothetical protein HY819_10755, partial [Acidobacteria bacterium]|nr:hypothetical protein [Acidobacteriota bacterium]